MNVKRVLTGVIAAPILTLFFIFGNKYMMDIFIAVVACIAMHEYSDCISKEAKSLSWIGYILCIGIAFLHVIPVEIYAMATLVGVPTILLLLFLQIVLTDMIINFKDVAFTFIGIMYVVCFTVFVAALYGYNDQRNSEVYNQMRDGKFLIWYLFIASWVSDVFAYEFGCKFGKHKFSKVSPKKSIEGCIAGVVGSVLVAILYTFVLNQFDGVVTYKYLTIGIVTAILCVIGQIGDFAASTIKRYFEVKDFSELIPGHGGIIDRIDSVIFMAPYAYLIFTVILDLHVVA